MKKTMFLFGFLNEKLKFHWDELEMLCEDKDHKF